MHVFFSLLVFLFIQFKNMLNLWFPKETIIQLSLVFVTQTIPEMSVLTAGAQYSLSFRRSELFKQIKFSFFCQICFSFQNLKPMRYV